MKKIFVLIVLFFCTSAIYAQSTFDLVKKDVEMGKAFLNEGNRKEAQKMFDAAIRRSVSKKFREGHPDAFMLIGDAYLTCASPDIKTAFNVYKSICEMDKKYCDKLNNPIFDGL